MEDKKPIHVQSYIRNAKPHKKVTTLDPVAATLLAVVLIAALVIYWYITIALMIIGGAWLLSRYIPEQRVITLEEPKQKRGYHRRMTINHFQHGTLKV